MDNATVSPKRARLYLPGFDPDALAAFPELLALRLHGEDFPHVRAGAPSERLTTAQRMERMRRWCSDLVHVTLKLPDLLLMPWRTPELKTAAKQAVTARLKKLAPTAEAYMAFLRRGGRFDGIHAHVVLPLAALVIDMRAVAVAAPAGKGGGAEYDGDTHVCRVGPSDNDIERLSAYLSSDPDERFRLAFFDQPAYLQAHEDRLEHLALNLPRVRLAWHKQPRHWN